jgi:hypothetical protein
MTRNALCNENIWLFCTRLNELGRILLIYAICEAERGLMLAFLVGGRFFL